MSEAAESNRRGLSWISRRIEREQIVTSGGGPVAVFSIWEHVEWWTLSSGLPWVRPLCVSQILLVSPATRMKQPLDAFRVEADDSPPQSPRSAWWGPGDCPVAIFKSARNADCCYCDNRHAGQDGGDHC